MVAGDREGDAGPHRVGFVFVGIGQGPRRGPGAGRPAAAGQPGGPPTEPTPRAMAEVAQGGPLRTRHRRCGDPHRRSPDPRAPRGGDPGGPGRALVPAAAADRLVESLADRLDLTEMDQPIPLGSARSRAPRVRSGPGAAVRRPAHRPPLRIGPQPRRGSVVGDDPGSDRGVGSPVADRGSWPSAGISAGEVAVRHIAGLPHPLADGAPLPEIRPRSGVRRHHGDGGPAAAGAGRGDPVEITLTAVGQAAQRIRIAVPRHEAAPGSWPLQGIEVVGSDADVTWIPADDPGFADQSGEITLILPEGPATGRPRSPSRSTAAGPGPTATSPIWDRWGDRAVCSG